MNEVVQAIERYVSRSFMDLDPKSFGQEPAYISALMGRLIGTAWEDDDGAYVKFKTTVVNDRGRNSAESRYGADFAITLELNGPDTFSKKAILGQGKRGSLERLSQNEKSRLISQCSMMAKHTHHYLLLETPADENRMPSIRIGRGQNNIRFEQQQSLTDYIVNQFIRCHHGDTRDNFVAAVQDSGLNCLEILVEGLEPDLALRPRPAPGSGPAPGMF